MKTKFTTRIFTVVLIFFVSGLNAQISIEGRYWKYNNERILLIGGWNHGHNPHIDHDESDANGSQGVSTEEEIKAAIAELADVGGNLLRLVLNPGMAAGIQNHDFTATSGSKYDLNTMTGPFWTRLDMFIAEAEAKGIVVQLEIWDRFDLIDGVWNSWPVSPFNPNNNINYTTAQSGLATSYSSYDNHPFLKGVPGHPDYDSASTIVKSQYDVVRSFQEKFVDKILSITFQYDNVLYCMNNETHEDPKWGEYWIDYIRDKATIAGKSILTTDMLDKMYEGKNGTDWQYQANNSNSYDYVDVSQVNSRHRDEVSWNIIKGIADDAKSKNILLHMTKVYGNDLSSNGNPWDSWAPGDTDNAVEEVWRGLIAGVAGLRFHRPTSGIGMSNLSKNTIKVVRLVEEKVKFWDVEPHQELLGNKSSDEAYLAADLGEKYILYYTANGEGSVTIDLTAYSGDDFDVNWVNIDSGTLDSSTTISGGSNVALNRPGSGHWAATIVKSGGTGTVVQDPDSFTTSLDIGDGSKPAIAIDTDNRIIHLAYVDDTKLMYRQGDLDGNFGAAEEILTGRTIGGAQYRFWQPSIILDQNNKPHITVTEGRNQWKGMYISYINRINGTWSSPLTVFDIPNDDTLAFGLNSFMAIEGNKAYIASFLIKGPDSNLAPANRYVRIDNIDTTPVKATESLTDHFATIFPYLKNNGELWAFYGLTTTGWAREWSVQQLDKNTMQEIGPRQLVLSKKLGEQVRWLYDNSGEIHAAGAAAIGDNPNFEGWYKTLSMSDAIFYSTSNIHANGAAQPIRDLVSPNRVYVTYWDGDFGADHFGNNGENPWGCTVANQINFMRVENGVKVTEGQKITGRTSGIHGTSYRTSPAAAAHPDGGMIVVFPECGEINSEGSLYNGPMRLYFTHIGKTGQTGTPSCENIDNISATASASEGTSVPANTLDNDLSTRWSAEGGQWISYDLGGTYILTNLDIAFHKGDERNYSFNIEVSTDGSSWTQVFSGQSAGITTEMESFSFPDAPAKHVRINGSGNSVNNWNSYSEVAICGEQDDTPLLLSCENIDNISATASTSEGTSTPANTLDNDLTTRWSAEGDQWVSYDLGNQYMLTHLDIAFHKGNERNYTFNIEVSTDGSNWTQVFSGQSAGITTEMESFSFPNTPAKHVRINGSGNSVNNWNSYSEVAICGEQDDTPLLLSCENIDNISATASASEGTSTPANTLDNDLTTRWSAEGDQWVSYDLGSQYLLTHLDIAFHKGEQRNYTFNIEVSTDGSNWTQVFSGQSGGATREMESFDFTDISAQYVRINGSGNSVNNWNSYSEVAICGEQDSTPLPSCENIDNISATASASEGTSLPANTLDKDLTTRWSAEGDQWVSYDLGSQYLLTHLDIAFHKGEQRNYTFNIEVSTDGSDWTQVFSGQSGGATREMESFDFTDISAQYVRINGSGNSVNNWNSYSEVAICESQTPPTQYTLAVNKAGNGSVDPTGSTYDSGTVATLTATPDTGWKFTGWSGDLSGTENPASITMDGNKTVTATFSEEDLDTTISISPNPTSGVLTINTGDGVLLYAVIYNELGKKIKETTTTSEMDISNMASGVYFVKVVLQSGKAVTKKIIKE